MKNEQILGILTGTYIKVDQVSGAITANPALPAPISLTTTGQSGSASLVAGVLNIPNYSVAANSNTTYTPVATIITNASSLPAVGGKYLVIGDIVMLFLSFQIYPSASGLVEVDITLPVNSKWQGGVPPYGTATIRNTADDSFILGVARILVANKVRLQFHAVTTDSHGVFAQIIYNLES